MKKLCALLLALCLLAAAVAFAEPVATDAPDATDAPAETDATDVPAEPDVPVEADVPAEEESDPGAIEAEPSYKGSYAAIADTGLKFLLPDDWRAVQPPSSVAGSVYSNGDGSIALTVVASEGNLADLQESYAAALEDGTLSECADLSVNGVDWVLITTADAMQYYAQTQIDEDRVLSFVFVVADPAVSPEIELEMIGSLTGDR